MNRRVTVSALIEYGGKYLVCTQNCGIFLNTVHIPGGGVEGNESCEEALRREVREECGIEICNIHRFGFDDRIISLNGSDVHYIFLRYLASANSSKVTPGDDVKEAYWVTAEEFVNLNHNEITQKFIKDLQSAGLLRR